VFADKSKTAGFPQRHAYAVPDSTIAPDRNRTRPDPKCRRIDLT